MQLITPTDLSSAISIDPTSMKCHSMWWFTRKKTEQYPEAKVAAQLLLWLTQRLIKLATIAKNGTDAFIRWITKIQELVSQAWFWILSKLFSFHLNRAWCQDAKRQNTSDKSPWSQSSGKLYCNNSSFIKKEIQCLLAHTNQKTQMTYNINHDEQMFLHAKALDSFTILNSVNVYPCFDDNYIYLWFKEKK